MHAFLLKRKLEDLSSEWKAVTHLLQELKAKWPVPAPGLTAIGARKYAGSHPLWLWTFARKHNSEMLPGLKGKWVAMLKIGINLGYLQCKMS